MENREYTDKEIDTFIDFVKDSDAPEQSKQRRIDFLEGMRPEKKKEIELATEEEVDAILGGISPSYRKDKLKPKIDEANKTAEQKAMDQVINDAFGYLDRI